jgi:hypothetical protein
VRGFRRLIYLLTRPFPQQRKQAPLFQHRSSPSITMRYLALARTRMVSSIFAAVYTATLKDSNDGNFSLICDWSAPVPAITCYWRACRRTYTPSLLHPMLVSGHCIPQESAQWTNTPRASLTLAGIKLYPPFLIEPATSLPVSKLRIRTVLSQVNVGDSGVVKRRMPGACAEQGEIAERCPTCL